MKSRAFKRLLAAQAALLTSSAVAGAIHTSQIWTHWPSPQTAMWSSAIYLGPAVLIVALFDTKTSVLVWFTILASAASAWMWVTFANDYSSTAIFIYAAGLVVGIPLALAIGAIGRFRRVPPPPPQVS